MLGAGTLHQLRLLDYIEIYLKAARAVWDRSSVLSRDFGLQSPLVGVVDFLLAEYESAEAGSALALTHKDIQAVKQAPGQTAQISAPGYAKHLFHDLLDMLQRPDHLALKDNLQNFKDTLVTDFVLIFDTVMGSGCEIFVKFMLEYIQSTIHCCAAVDGLQGFVNEGVALVGMVKTNHDLKALEFLQAVIAEQAARFKSFAGSDDPVTPFPSPFVLDSSPALVLKDEYLLELEALKKAARCQPALMRLDELHNGSPII